MCFPNTRIPNQQQTSLVHWVFFYEPAGRHPSGSEM
jgi:hypothetical protein